MPPANIRPMDTVPAQVAKMIIMLDGGIMGPIIAVAAVTQVEKSLG